MLEKNRENMTGGLSIVFTCKTAADKKNFKDRAIYAKHLLALMLVNCT